MTKAEIVEQIYEQVGFSKKESAELVEKVFETIKETLARGEKVKISGFGNFVVREKNARKGRNPQTGEEILLEARDVITHLAPGYGKRVLRLVAEHERLAASLDELLDVPQRRVVRALRQRRPLRRRFARDRRRETANLAGS